MSLPDNIHWSEPNLDLVLVYSPLPGTTRRTATKDGVQYDFVIVQSPPTKAGRLRHVIRYTVTNAPDLNGKRAQNTVTVTFDHDASLVNYTDVAYGLTQIEQVFGTYLAGIVQGQQ